MQQPDPRPWRTLCRRGLDESLVALPGTLVDAWAGRVAASPNRSAIAYFDTSFTAAEDEVIAFAAERLAAYKRPAEVHVIGELPKMQTGKIRRRELRDQHVPSADHSLLTDTD